MPFQKYLDFIKLEHSLFSLPLLFSGAVLAGRDWPSFRITILILVAGACARVVAMSLNRIIDRDIDRKNPRTKNRHLAIGSMKLIEAWLTVLVSLGIYLYCTWLISDFCLKLSWIPIVAFSVYPYFKRFTQWAHIGLGLVWALVPIGGFFAIEPSLRGIGPVLVLAVFCLFWLAGFDIIYATMDEEFDRRENLHSLPANWGSKKALVAARFFHIFAFLSLFAIYGIWLSGPITILLLVVIGICFYIEHKFTQTVDFAFFQMNVAIGVIVFFFIFSGIKGY